jgi:predicted metal-dependent enzyme (double-stranded beta helix superfamily)
MAGKAVQGQPEEVKVMSWTLEKFAAACQQALTEDPGPAGRKKVCEVVQEVLKDEAFVGKYVGDDVPERKILYEDPKLGFCILAHVYTGKKESNPHDHGPSWAIYGQARGETVMSDWTLVETAKPDKPGKVRLATSYTLKPGMAHVYNEGDLHSPRRDGPTRLIRIEGTNMDKVKRLAYERV